MATPAYAVAHTEAGSPQGRIAGISAMAFAVIVGAQNIGRAILGSPPNDASGAEVAAFFAANSSLLFAGISSVSVAMLCLFTFYATVHPLISDGPSAVWARLGTAGGIFLASSF